MAYSKMTPEQYVIRLTSWVRTLKAFIDGRVFTEQTRADGLDYAQRISDATAHYHKILKFTAEQTARIEMLVDEYEHYIELLHSRESADGVYHSPVGIMTGVTADGRPAFVSPSGGPVFADSPTYDLFPEATLTQNGTAEMGPPLLALAGAAVLAFIALR